MTTPGQSIIIDIKPAVQHAKPIFVPLVKYKTRSACTKMASSRYLKANLVNLVYAIIMMVMDVAVYSNELEGLVYLLLAVIHCVNACMYLWVWLGEGRAILCMFCLPDWLNGVCALFYLATGFCAPYMYDAAGHPTDIFKQVRRIELFLSVLECVAAVGWVYQWYAAFIVDLRLRPKQCRGRGWTLDDPDLWGNISLIIAASFYIVYNIIICLDNYKYYETSTLYFWGDFWYLINAISYVMCSLRDCDCFWFMPQSGHLPDYERMVEECGLLDGSQHCGDSFQLDGESSSSWMHRCETSSSEATPYSRGSRGRPGSVSSDEGDIALIGISAAGSTNNINRSTGGSGGDEEVEPLLPQQKKEDKQRV